MVQTILKIQDLQVKYGSITAVKGISLEVKEGQLVALIGSNGAGKTSTLNAVAGSLQSTSGSIEFAGSPVCGKGAWDLVKSGLALVPEGRGVFARMSIYENLLMGCLHQR